MQREKKDKAGHLISRIIFMMVIGGSVWGLFQLDLTSLIFNKQEMAPEVKPMTQKQFQEIVGVWKEKEYGNKVGLVNDKPVPSE